MQILILIILPRPNPSLSRARLSSRDCSQVIQIGCAIFLWGVSRKTYDIVNIFRVYLLYSGRCCLIIINIVIIKLYVVVKVIKPFLFFLGLVIEKFVIIIITLDNRLLYSL